MAISDRRTATGALPSIDMFRQIYVGLDIPEERAPAVIGITSAIHGEGCTTIALGLARMLADDLDKPVVLVDAAFERPALATYFGVASEPGLCDVLRGTHEWSDVVRPISESLSIVTAGTVAADADKLLRQLPRRDLFHEQSNGEGVIIIDFPPLLAHSYSAIAAGITDASVLVVRAGVTPLPLLQAATDRLKNHPPHGVVLNGARSAFPRWWPSIQLIG